MIEDFIFPNNSFPTTLENYRRIATFDPLYHEIQLLYPSFLYNVYNCAIFSIDLYIFLLASRLICQRARSPGRCQKHRGIFAKQVVLPRQLERIQCELVPFADRAICLRSRSRSPWHGKCARVLIESFVQNRTQLLRPVIQSGTMSSQPDTSLSRNARSRYARSYLATRSEMQIKVSSHNWSSLSTYLSEKCARTSELSLPSFLSNIDMKYKCRNAR